MEAVTAFVLAGLLCAQSYDVARIAKEDRIDGVWVEDVDGKGKPDLLVQVGRRLDLHLDLSPKPSETLLLDERPFLWTLCRLEERSGLSVATFTSAGVFVHRRSERGWDRTATPQVVHPNLFRGTLGLRAAPVRLDFMPRIDADALSDLIYFGERATMVMVRRGGRFELRQKIRLPVESSAVLGWWPRPEISETVRIPFLYVQDLNGDGRNDLACFRNGRLSIYRQTDKGDFPSRPERSLPIVKDTGSRFLKIQKPPDLVDLDNDGSADAVHVSVGAGAAEIFYGRDGLPSTADPVQRQVGDSWGLWARAPVMNRSGRRCLILRTVERIGMLEAVEVLRAQEAKLRVTFYPIDERGRPARTAARHLKLRLPFVAKVSQFAFDLRRLFHPVVADLDGDGAKDFVVVSKDRRLVRYPGTADGAVAETAVAVGAFRVPASAVEVRLIPADLNGDGRSDLILRIRHKNGKDSLAILTSK